MRKTYLIPGGMILIVLLCGIGAAAVQENSASPPGVDIVSDDIKPFEGTIGADNPLYGLKIAMEDLDETFTFNRTRRVEKQADHAQIRIAEFRWELELNRTDSAERVLELYQQKLNLTEKSLAAFGSDEPGLLRAQEMFTQHQAVLARLLDSHPDNPGLSRAYNNSLSLGEMFSQKTAMKFSCVTGKDNKTILKAVRVDTREETRARDNVSPTETGIGNKNENREKINDQKDGIAVNTTVTQKPGNREDPGKKRT